MMPVMRAAIVAAVLAACGAPEPVHPEDYARRLVTDDLPYGSERAAVRAWFEAHDGCRARTWDATDEFVGCDPHPTQNHATRPEITLVRYDAAGKAEAFAAFVQVPCRMYGKCDAMVEPQQLRELDFVDHRAGLRAGLVEVGEREPAHTYGLPSMQQRTLDGLAVELGHRYGPPVWEHPHRFGEVWTTPSERIGLFVIDDGGWVIETHELRPATLTARGGR